MGTQDIFAIERNGGNVVATHIISRNHICGPGSYTATLSYEAFRRRESERAFPETKKGYVLLGKKSPTIRWFAMYIKEHFDEEQEITQGICMETLGHRIVQPWHSVPEFRHDSIWDFYRYIGYDWKKKRYIKQEKT